MNFNFETIGYKNLIAHELLSKKYAIPFWFKNLTSFLAMKRKKLVYFSDKSLCALEFLLPIVSKLKFINLERSYCVFFYFQAITLSMRNSDQMAISTTHSTL